jgi:hypothetical protein
MSLHLAARGGKQAKSKAIVAVTRKLAVLLRCLSIDSPLETPTCAELSSRQLIQSANRNPVEEKPRATTEAKIP